MTTRPPTPIQRIIAPLLAAVMVALGVAVPVLDSAEAGGGPVFETEHHSSCVTGHDHTICTQVGANLALGTRVSPPKVPESEPVPPTPALVPDVAEADRARRHRPRAPPFI